MTFPLFVPADRPDRFAKAASAAPDAVILDLEDAVPPGAKSAARANLATTFTPLPVWVRINAIGSPWALDDLAAVQALRPAAVILPKADLSTLAALPANLPPIIALVESARGLADARAIAADPRVRQLAFGSFDFCADLGLAHDRDILLTVRLELVLAARLAGRAPPLDGVTAGIDDAARITDDAAHAQALGMAGKLIIHPRQLAPARAGFQPSEAEIAWARRVLDSGDGAAQVDGAMVDEPVRLRAQAILDRMAKRQS